MVVKRWVEVASPEEIAEAIDIPSSVGTALCMAAALKKDHEIGNVQNYTGLRFMIYMFKLLVKW